MATNAGNTGNTRGPRGQRNPASILEAVLQSPSGAHMVGAMLKAGINVPEDVHDGSPIRLQLIRSINVPLDREQQDQIGFFVMHWVDASDPTGARVRNEARNANTVKPLALQLIQDLNGANTQSAQRTTSSAKKAETASRLDQLIGLKPGRPDSDPNPIINSIMGQGAGGGGNDLISAMLVLNELSENTPLPIHIGPRRTETIDVRREWAEKSALTAMKVIVAIGVTILVGLALTTHWSVALVAAGVFIYAIWWTIRQLVDAGGRFFRKIFPQFDEDGFRKKVIKQCETTLAFLLFGTEPVTKEEIVQWGLAPKFLEEVDGELRKEGFVYNRFDEQIDDWVRSWLGLDPVKPVKSDTNWIDRVSKFLDEHGW